MRSRNWITTAFGILLIAAIMMGLGWGAVEFVKWLRARELDHKLE